MPTLDDLRAVFTDLEQRAPLPQPLTTEPTEPRRRRGRWGAAALAAAAVAVVAVGVTVYASRSPEETVAKKSPAQSAPSAPPSAFAAALAAPRPGSSAQLSFGFAVDPVAGYAVTPALIDVSSQSAEIHSTDEKMGGELLIYYAGAFDPSAAERGTPVSVNGRPGYYTRLQLPADTGLYHATGRYAAGTARYDALAWQYADDGWAVVYLWDLLAAKSSPPVQLSGAALAALQADELQLASATHAAETPVHVPVKITGLSGQVTELSPSGGLTLSTGNVTWALGWGHHALNAADKPNTDTTTFDGRQWLVYHDRVTGAITAFGASAPGFGMTINPAAGGTASLSDYHEFLAHVSFASDLGDPNTWFDAETALP